MPAHQRMSLKGMLATNIIANHITGMANLHHSKLVRMQVSYPKKMAKVRTEAEPLRIKGRLMQSYTC
jgi:hypothetical protein